MIKVRRSFLLAVLLGVLLSAAVAYGQRPLRIRGERWLTVSEINGYVEIVPFQGERRQAQIGDFLDRAGDLLITGDNASARLDVDQAVGYIRMAENSQLQIRALSVTQSGGYITDLFVLLGQVRLRIRPLTNPASRIEIYTPAGVTGVRGTDFGVTVQTEGTTGVATLEGSVASSAQGETVRVNTRQQSLTRPGEPPTPPEPLRDDPTLYIEVLRQLGGGQTDDMGNPLVQIAGFTDIVNLLDIEDDRKILDEAGRFDLTVPLPANKRISAQVITPLGTVQNYELVLP